MGLATRHTRSASVETSKLCNMLVLGRPSFDTLLRSDRELQTKFYQNVIGMLAGKIVGDNVRVRDHLLEKVEPAPPALRAAASRHDLADSAESMSTRTRGPCSCWRRR